MAKNVFVRQDEIISIRNGKNIIIYFLFFCELKLMNGL